MHKANDTNKPVKVLLRKKQLKLGALLLDIEGTTTPISFVHQELFPYASQHVRQHLEETWDDPVTIQDINDLRLQAQKDVENKEGNIIIPSEGSKEDILSLVIEYVNIQMDKNKKNTSLKQLQGHIWEKGYNRGDIKGFVYDDAYHAILKCHENKIPVYIYSSGSILSQKLLFGHSIHGDICQYLSGYFDTTIGQKVETQSYLKISKEIKVEDDKVILFITDRIEEAIAASQAKMETFISIREGNEAIPLEKLKSFITITTFDDIWKKY